MGSSPSLFDIAFNGLSKLEKKADVPMDANGVKAGGMMPPGGMPPMPTPPPMSPPMSADPAAMASMLGANPMAAAGGGMPQMDPSMMMAGGGGIPQEALLAAAGGAGAPGMVQVSLDDLKQLLRDVQGGERGEGKPAEKSTIADLVDRVESLEMMIAQLVETLGGGLGGMEGSGDMMMPGDAEALSQAEGMSPMLGMPPTGGMPPEGIGQGIDLGAEGMVPSSGMEISASDSGRGVAYNIGQVIASARASLDQKFGG